MTTLAVDKPRVYQLAELSDYPCIASDIVYEGAAVGVVDGTGYYRPLVAGDRFVGFCTQVCDNSAGAAGAKTIRTRVYGAIQLAVSGAVITDVGQPVYATDDDTFVFLPTGGSFIGYVRRFISAGIVVVEFDPVNTQDPYGTSPRATLAANTTLDATYSGKTIFITADATTMTLPAILGIGAIKIVNLGAFGTQAVTVAPNAADMVRGPGITAADTKGVINTKATARRGDYVTIRYGDTDSWTIEDQRGIWPRVA